MNEDKKLKFKNDRVEEMLQRSADFYARPKEEQTYKGFSDGELAELVISSYATDMLASSYQIDRPLDFTYETLDRMPLVLRADLLRYMGGGRTVRQSVEALAKSFAAYIFFLTVNEHDCRWTVSKMRTALTPKEAEFGPLWAEIYRVTAGIRREEDFLTAALAGAQVKVGDKKALVMLDAAPTVKAYRRAFRVDLREHGLVSFATEIDMKE